MIVVRDRSFALDSASVLRWRDSDLAAAAFYDSLSMLFPQGERFFMDSVRRYRDAVDGPLRTDVRQFIAQEALHTREHLAFNTQVASSGAETSRCEERTRRELDKVRSRRSPVAQLAGTAALEHFTALLAHHLLAQPEHLASAPEATRQLWRWHAGEEIEHKAVAFDVLMHVTASWSPFRRWGLRCAIFVETMCRLARVAAPNFVDLHRQYGGVHSLRELAAYVLVRPGLLRRLLPALAGYLRPGFHPWEMDDAALAQAALLA